MKNFWQEREIKTEKMFEKFWDIMYTKQIADSKVFEDLESLIIKLGINILDFERRIKDLESCKQKYIMGKTITDFNGIRIILDNEEDCTKLFSKIIEDIPEFNVFSIKNYIMYPKINWYKSIHLKGYYQNKFFELQIRTKEMEEKINKEAPHELYKEQELKYHRNFLLKYWEF